MQCFDMAQTHRRLVQAVEATKNVEGGNVQLQKAIRLNTSARWYIFVLFMVASLGLLFLDWFSS